MACVWIVDQLQRVADDRLGTAILAARTLTEYFDFAFLAEEIGASKPHPDMFDAALAKAGVKAENIVHVGDDPDHDVRGALDAGFRTVWVNLSDKTWPGGQRADEEVNELQALPAAIERIHSGI